MRAFTGVLAALLALGLGGCASTETRSTASADCAEAGGDQTYFAILDFQRGLNETAERLEGEWQASAAALFTRLDQRIAALNKAADAAPAACREGLGREALRLRAVRARGEDYVATLKRHLAESNQAALKLDKASREARLGGLSLRLLRVDDGGQRFTLKLRNTDRKRPLLIATHRVQPAADGGKPAARPAYFLLADELGYSYPLMAVSLVATAQTPFKLAPGAERELQLTFAGPYVAEAHKLTLMIDASLLPRDPKRLTAPPAALVIPRQMILDKPRPAFVAEPGRQGL